MRVALIRLSSRNLDTGAPVFVDVRLDYLWAPPVIPIMGTWSCLPGYLTADSGHWDLEHKSRLLLITDTAIIVLGGVDVKWIAGYPFQLLLGHTGNYIRLQPGGVLGYEGKWQFLAV